MAEKKKKKKKEWAPMAFPAPQERNLSKELGEVMPMVGDLARLQSDLDVEAQKKIAEQQWDFMTRHRGEMVEFTKQDAELSRQLQELERQGSRAFLRDTGPAMWQEAKAGMPELGRAVGAIDRQISQIGQPPSPFTPELDEQIMSELKLGGALTPEAERAAQQTARQAYAARGQVTGNAASVAEVLTRDEASRARLRERQGLASQREAVGIQQQSLDRQFAMGSAALLDQLNPAYKVLGLQTTTNVPALATTQTLGSFRGEAPSVGSIMGAGLGYGQDLYSTNLNMSTDLFVNYQNAMAQIDASKRTSAAQIKAAKLQAAAMTSAAKTGAQGQMMGSLIGAGGAVAGGLIAF